jgi:hypothetical protein
MTIANGGRPVVVATNVAPIHGRLSGWFRGGSGSLWGSGLPRVWGFGRNALVAGWATGRLTG